MKKNLFPSGLVKAAVLFGCACLFGPANLRAQSATGWTGASDGTWSNAGNWTNGIPGSTQQGASVRILNFGSAGNARPNSTNDINSLSGHRIFFNAGAASYTLFLKAGTNGTTLNDFGGNIPKIENDSANVQTIDMAFKIQAKGNSVPNQAGELDPSIDDLVFTTNSVITLITNTQMRFFSSAGHAVTFYGPVLNSAGLSNTCALMTSGTGAPGTTVNFFNTNGCYNTFIYNGTVRLGTNNVTSFPLTLGDTNPISAAASALQMDNGLSNNSPLVVLTGSTNSRTIGNTAFGGGVADFTGPVSLGTNLTLLANAAGTLEFDGNFDFQNPGGVNTRTLLVSGAGNTFITGSLTNASTGISVLTKTNAGTLALAGTNNGSFILYHLGGGVLAITNASAIGIPTGVNYPDKFSFTGNATLSVTNSFTLGRNASGSDNAGFRINGGSTGTVDVAPGSTFTIDGPIIDIPATGSGSLTKIDNGTLELQQTNTYSGNTTVSGGTLALKGPGSIATSPNIIVAGGATFNVSGLASTFALGSSQTLSNSASTAVIDGSAGTGSGTVALTYAAGTPAFTVTNGTLTLSASTIFKINNTGSPLAAGIYEIISTNSDVAGSAAAVAGTLPAVTVTGGSVAGGTVPVLTLINNELYLVVDQPLAATMTVYRTAGLSLKVALSDLATNWSNAAGYPPSLAGINLVTTNGVNLMTNSSYIFYTNGPNAADQISYTIGDSLGTTATGLINVVMNPFVTGQSSTVTVSGSSATVSFAGIPGYSYNVLRSTNLVTWVTIETTNAPANGLFNYTDTFSDLGAVPASAYYQLQWNP